MTFDVSLEGGGEGECCFLWHHGAVIFQAVGDAAVSLSEAKCQ